MRSCHINYYLYNSTGKDIMIRIKLCSYPYTFALCFNFDSFVTAVIPLHFGFAAQIFSCSLSCIITQTRSAHIPVIMKNTVASLSIAS